MSIPQPVRHRHVGFHWAANRGNPETVELLIERGAPLEQKNMYDGTVLSLHSVVGGRGTLVPIMLK